MVRFEGYKVVPEDSRLKGYNGTVTHPHLPMERTYCAQCGKPKGWVSVDTFDYIRFMNILVLCDQCQFDLQVKFGSLPLAECPIEEFR